MATSLGKAGYLLVSAVTAVELRNYQLTRTSDTTEDTVIGDSWKTRKATLNDYSISASLFWDASDDPAQVAASTAIDAGSAVTVVLYPEGDDAGDVYYTGSGIVTDLGASASHDGMVERSFSLQGTGPLTESTV
jgi:predicted secreted protein